MVVFTSVLAYIIVGGLSQGIVSVVILGIGGFLITGAANVLNEVLEIDYDRMMLRTANRPLVTGRWSMSQGVLIAGFMCLTGITVLALFNPLTAILGMISLVTYAFVYTPLKRYSSVAIPVGAIPGAMPVLIGCVAYESIISPIGLMLFAFLILWQFPHFWAIGVLGKDEYIKAGFKLVPMKNGEVRNGVFLSSVIGCAMISVWVIGYIGLGMVSIGIGLVILVLSLVFLYISILFAQKRNRESALKLMLSSIVFLPVVLILLLLNGMI